MIIEQLKKLAEREQLLIDEGYGPQKIHGLVSVDRDGRFLGITPTLEPPASGRGQPKPKQFAVPSPISRRTSGPMANFLYDKADYVFGIGDDAEKAKNRSRLFRDAIHEALAATGDEGLRAVTEFLQRVDRGQEKIDVSGYPEGAVFSFLDFDEPGRLISSRPAVRAYWIRRRSAVPDGGTADVECILCGSRSGIVRNHPEIRNVPGGNPAGVALVSFNNPAARSYGFDEGESHLNAPFCRSCSDGYTRALNRLLAPEPGFPHPTVPGTTLPVLNTKLSSDTVALFWSTGSEFASFFGRALHGDPRAVKALLESPHTGKPADLTADHFYAIILTGVQGRAVLRSAIQSTVAEVRENVRAHFEDLALVPQFATEAQHCAIRDLLGSLKPPGSTATLPPSLAQEMFEAAALGRPYPRTLLDAALRRLRAGEPFSRPRISVVKAVLRRLPNMSKEDLTMALNPDNIQPGYRLGRLFAVLERLQGDAINTPNATIVDRYYGSASTTPAVVFPRLIGLAQHHASKSGRGGYFQKLIEEIAWGLDPDDAFPSALPLEQQGLFALGYYHQRAELWRKKDGGDAEPTA